MWRKKKKSFTWAQVMSYEEISFKYDITDFTSLHFSILSVRMSEGDVCKCCSYICTLKIDEILQSIHQNKPGMYIYCKEQMIYEVHTSTAPITWASNHKCVQHHMQNSLDKSINILIGDQVSSHTMPGTEGRLLWHERKKLVHTYILCQFYRKIVSSI